MKWSKSYSCGLSQWVSNLYLIEKLSNNNYSVRIYIGSIGGLGINREFATATSLNAAKQLAKEHHE